MNLMHLERILFIAKIGNITEAAAKLYISQSALSQMVNAVEEELGAPIFDRRVKPLRLTNAGERYIAMARYVINAYNGMLNEISNIKSGTTGVISCGISARRSRVMLPSILRAVSAAYPLVTLQLAAEDVRGLESLLLRGELDMAFGSLPPHDSNLGSVKLNDEKYMLVAQLDSHFARRMDAYCMSVGDRAAPIALSEARNEMIIATPLGTESRKALELMFEEHQISPLVAFEVFNTDIAVEYSRHGLGISVIPQTFRNNVPFEYQTNSISFFNINSRYAQRSAYLNFHKSILVSPPHRYLFNLIMEHYGHQGHINERQSSGLWKEA